MLALTELLFDALFLLSFGLASPTVEPLEDCAKFNYTNNGSDWTAQCPSKWGLCSSGQMQSPIDLPAGEFASTHTPKFHLPDEAIAGELFNRGEGLEWTPAGGSHHMLENPYDAQTPLHVEDLQVPTLEFDGDTYNLLQWHFHTPASEHSYGGQRRDAEVHFVFGEGKTPKAVVGIGVVQADSTEPFFASMFQGLPEGSKLPAIGDKIRYKVSLDFRTIFDTLHMENYWTYRGSLTTPPCTEGIRWFLGAGNATISGLIHDYEDIIEAGERCDREVQATTAEHQVNQ